MREALEGDIEALSALELEGLIQRFEFAFELGWKLLEDRLEHDGVSLMSVQDSMSGVPGLPDVPDDAMRAMIRVFSSYPDLEKVTLFGSRATGAANPWSDIDLATHGIVGDRHRLGRLALDLEDTDIPQTCGVLAYEAISHARLKQHVDNVGIVI